MSSQVSLYGPGGAGGQASVPESLGYDTGSGENNLGDIRGDYWTPPQASGPAVPSIEDHAKAYDPNSAQRSPNTTNGSVYESQPVLQQVAVPVEVKTLDWKMGVLIFGLGFLAFKYFRRK